MTKFYRLKGAYFIAIFALLIIALFVPPIFFFHYHDAAAGSVKTRQFECPTGTVMIDGVEDHYRILVCVPGKPAKEVWK